MSEVPKPKKYKPYDKGSKQVQKPPPVKPCSFCVHPRNEEMTEKYMRGELTSAQAGEIVGKSGSTFRYHMQNHVLPKLQPKIAKKMAPVVKQLAESKAARIYVLSDLVYRMKERVDKLLSGTVVTGVEKQVKMLAGEIRQAMETINKIEDSLGLPVQGAESEAINYEMFKAFRDIVFNRLQEHPKTWAEINSDFAGLISGEVELVVVTSDQEKLEDDITREAIGLVIQARNKTEGEEEEEIEGNEMS